MKSVRLILTGRRHGNLIEVDGHDLTDVCVGVDLEAHSQNMPILRIDLIAHPIEINGEIYIALDPKVHEALIAIGWTPPSESS